MDGKTFFIELFKKIYSRTIQLFRSGLKFDYPWPIHVEKATWSNNVIMAFHNVFCYASTINNCIITLPRHVQIQNLCRLSTEILTRVYGQCDSKYWGTSYLQLPGKLYGCKILILNKI